MRVGNLSGRLTLFTDTGAGAGFEAVDVEKASARQFSSDPQAVFERWGEFVDWAGDASLPPGDPFERSELGSPAPAPRQVLAIGLNYRAHVEESGFAAPETEPPVFTKFSSCIVGPDVKVQLPPDGHVDWEVELVAVIGRYAFGVAESEALSYVAGFAVGQDLSERRLQMAATPPQFSLGKSLPGFGPIGPWLVTLDELPDPDDLQLGCEINGETVQSGRTSELIFPVSTLVSKLSTTLPLLPGDIIFTGTPSGVGIGRTPPRWLADGDELHSYIGGIGDMRQHFTAG